MTDLSGEIWKPVPGFDTYYVSNLGRCKRTGLTGDIELKGKLDRIGYRQFGLLRKGGKQEWFLAHRLIAAVFLELPKEQNDRFMTVNHKNRIRDDNRIENLEFMSVADNHRHWRKLTLHHIADGVVC